MHVMTVSKCLEYCKEFGWMDDAAATIRDSTTEARERNHEYIGTEHILLAICRQIDSVAANVIRAQNATALAHLEGDISQLVHDGPAPPRHFFRGRIGKTIERMLKLDDPWDDPLLAPRSRWVVHEATSLANGLLNWRNGYVGTEHVLLALLADREGVAYHALVTMNNITYEDSLALARAMLHAAS
jgi:ATP-dependent Clp protease ATP-binding subunit ClpA